MPSNVTVHVMKMAQKKKLLSQKLTEISLNRKFFTVFIPIHFVLMKQMPG